MKTILSVDGGGSKLRMLLFNGDFEILGRGLAGGVNTNSTTAGNSLENVRNCLDQVFNGKPPDSIDKVYAVFVGPVETLLSELKKRTGVRETSVLSEPEAGIAAGAFWEKGFLALAGTGSDVFFVDKDRIRSRNGEDKTVVGGWGPLLGDQGSGFWIGHEAAKAAVSGIEGWTEKTLIHDFIRRDWGLQDNWDMAKLVYQDVSPFRKIAGLTCQVEEAAKAGDRVALSIVEKAGELMAVQALCLFRHCRPSPDTRRLVCCGGAWKTHPLMFGTFKQAILAEYPDFDIRKPLFEHLMAGPAFEMIRAGIPVSEAEKILAEKFPDWVITW